MKSMIEGEQDLEFVGHAHDGEEAVQLARKLRPDVAVLDLVMPRLDGVMATERLRSACPGTAVLILSGFMDRERIAAALRVGATGFVPKPARQDEVLQAIRWVAGGGTYLDGDMAAALFRTPPEPPVDAPAGRELDILRLAAWGYGNKEIADRFGMGLKAVESCKVRAMEKLGLKTRRDLMRYAVDNGWLAPGGAK
jgi:DNA-binding NarL/FixJ family response regulator